MSVSPRPCPVCGSAGAGKFCSQCGAAREGAACPGCGASLSSGARFCSKCGRSVGGGAAPLGSGRTSWLLAALALAVVLGGVLVMLVLRSPRRERPVELVESSTPGEGTPPDISNMSPRERFNRLYNRVMTAAQAGDEATVSRFTPMALMAYSQLDTIDADARYHVALLKVHTGDVAASRALADTILAQTPGHLFGYIVRGTAARFRKDQPELRRAYAEFLRRYDAEMRLERPEYAEHRTSLDDFRKAALDGK